MPEILMPRLSDTMEVGTLARWLKHEGDQIHKGDAVAEIETDKAVMELEAFDEGPLTRLLVPEGATVPIGAPVAVIGEQGPAPQPPPPEQAPAAEQAPPAAERPQPPPPARPAGPAPVAPPAASPPPGAPPAAAAQAAPPAARATADARPAPISPLARRLAAEHGIDLATLPGSGPGGRIIRADVDRAIARHGRQPAPPPSPAAPAPAPAATRPAASAQPVPPTAAEDYDEVPLNTVRRLTAQRLTESTQQAPHFYLTAVVDAEPLLSFRADLNTRLGDAGPRISVNDLIVKACATLLRSHPELNASWAQSAIRRHHRIHIGIAVALDDGLTVPVIHDADRLTLTQIARQAHGLADKARAGRLTLDELSGGTFTISNLGPYGIDHFTAVINPPQAAILALGAAHPEPVVRDGQVTAGTVMALTLSVDHRVLDGATGAVFLADLKSLLEQPLRILV